MNKAVGILIMAMLILVSALSLYLARPPALLPANADPKLFSAERALEHLNIISELPHSIGTGQNQKVRDYIVGESELLGLNVEVQNAQVLKSFPGFSRSAYVENIMARLPGSQPGKALLIMSHYDSQPHTPGAGDDGAGVAAMLEAMRILTEEPALNNDVIFLFTDGEEIGLTGANAFLEQHPWAKEVGLLLNFEGRGNSGPSLTFEVNQDNGWVMREYAKVAPYPSANSLSYEIYKALPNDTDFTVFKEQGIAGLNFAFIDGFVNYHSMTDTRENLNPNSLQHHGTYMVALAQHFGGLDLSQNTKGPDLTYFNPLGSWLVTYPSSWDLPLALFMVMLFSIWLYLSLRFKSIRWWQLLMGILFFILTLLLIGAFTWGGQWATKTLYPHYNNFYASNFYNAKYYLLTGLSFGVFIFLIIYRWLLKKYRATSLLAAILLLEIVVTAVMYQMAPTAIYIFTYPLIVIIMGQLIVLILGHNRRSLPYVLISALCFLPALLLWTPLIYNLFLAFSIDLLAAPIVLMVLLLGMGLPLFEAVVKSRIVVNGFFLLGFLFILLGHFSSSYNAKRPLQSDLIYGLNLDNEEAYWISNDLQLNEWNTQFLKEAKPQPFTAFYPQALGERLIQSAPLIDLGVLKPWMRIEKDTLINGQRQLSLLVGADDPAVGLELILSQTKVINYLKINQQVIGSNHYQKTRGFYQMQHHAKPSQGLKIELHIGTGIEMKLILIAKKIGLPTIALPPEYIIPATGFNSHTTQVKQTFQL